MIIGIIIGFLAAAVVVCLFMPLSGWESSGWRFRTLKQRRRDIRLNKEAYLLRLKILKQGLIQRDVQ